jgi:hypothetical protein
VEARPVDLTGAGRAWQPASGVRLTCGQKAGGAACWPPPLPLAATPVPAVARGEAPDDAAGLDTEEPDCPLDVVEGLAELAGPTGPAGLAELAGPTGPAGLAAAPLWMPEGDPFGAA